MEFQIGGFLIKLENLNDNDICRPYRAEDGLTYFDLVPRSSFHPTVGLCRRVVATLDLMFSKLGVIEVSLEFGVGHDASEYQGMIRTGIGRPLGDFMSNSTF